MAKKKETIPSSLLTLTIGIAVAAFSVWYGQNNHLLPEQLSSQAPLVDDLFNIMLCIATALFLLVEGTIIYTLIRFRHRPGDETDGEYIEGNFSLEVFWTAIPTFIVIVLGIYGVQVYNQMGGFDTVGQVAHHHHQHQVQLASLPADESNPMLLAERPEYGVGATPVEGLTPPDLEVDVLGMQYAWIFTYPSLGITSGELHVPMGQDIKLNITAQDVLHAFWLPQFRLKQDAIPGQPTQLRFVATKSGHYPIVCAELCGAYHGGMRSEIVVHEPDEFVTWISENQVAQNPDLEQAVALRTDGDRLQDYTTQMGLDATTVQAALKQP
ncbi:MAG: cytochrome c oxidase subunit II [Spirulina sp. SIO3F2]|nr:cytochrome c oxidase subunit II [Spirulina sp. SIO3F2]